MPLSSLSRSRTLPLLFILALTLLIPTLAAAQSPLTIRLETMNNSGVSGTAILTANGDATEVVLDLTGFPPNADAIANVNSNTCAQPSASFARIAGFTADANGNAHVTGTVLFHDTNMALSDLTGGENIISINSGGQLVACAPIPKLDTAAPAPTVPVTGGALNLASYAIPALTGLGILSAGLFLRRRYSDR